MDETKVAEVVDILLEKVSEKAHEVWAGWMTHMFRKGTWNPDGSLTIPAELVTRWSRQTLTQYKNLTDHEKKSDIEIAQEYVIIMTGTIMQYFTNMKVEEMLGAVNEEKTFKKDIVLDLHGLISGIGDISVTDWRITDDGYEFITPQGIVKVSNAEIMAMSASEIEAWKKLFSPEETGFLKKKERAIRLEMVELIELSNEELAVYLSQFPEYKSGENDDESDGRQEISE